MNERRDNMDIYIFKVTWNDFSSKSELYDMTINILFYNHISVQSVLQQMNLL